jgi:hypothetical protein
MHQWLAFGLAFLLAGCASYKASTDTDGYVRTRDADPCFVQMSNHSRQRSYFVKLDGALEERLLDLLDTHDSTSQRCWYERWDGSLFVQIGEQCSGYNEASFVRTNSAWRLEKFEKVPIILCNELKK